MQHASPIAQIIASILCSRRGQCNPGDCAHRDAHQRVMSVATATAAAGSGLNESIEIGPSPSCATALQSHGRTVGRSRSRCKRPLAGAVSGAVEPGLIVTELVGSTRKHAFPSGETGEILVGYDARGPDWTLSVSDNGAGSGDVSAERPHTGLGTSIVEALARQLDAIVQKSSGTKGTTVSIVAGTGAGGSREQRQRTSGPT
jgi:chemotaxis protein methyltransferase CheR